LALWLLTVEIRIPLKLRRVPVDKQHPDRVAVRRGPVVLAQEAQHDPLPAQKAGFLKQTTPGKDVEHLSAWITFRR
jgi:hypothetical protein